MGRSDGSVRSEYPALRLEDCFTPEEMKFISAFLDICKRGGIGHFEALVLVQEVETGHEAG